MLNPNVLRMAKILGVKIEDRAINNSYLFDGKSIGTHFYHCQWVGNGIINSYGFEEEDLVRIEGLAPIYLTDHDIMHDVLHYVCAAPEQRDLPEFGLGYVGGMYQECVVEVVDTDEANKQEGIVQLLCCYFGTKFGLHPRFCVAGTDPEYRKLKSWETYFKLKNRETNPSKWEDLMVPALEISQALDRLL